MDSELGGGQSQDWTEAGVRTGQGGVRVQCWAGSVEGQAGVGTGSVTLAMSSEACSRRGRGRDRGRSVSLLWLLLLTPLAAPGLRGSLPMATPTLAAGETSQGGAPARSAQPLAPGAPGTRTAGRRCVGRTPYTAGLGGRTVDGGQCPGLPSFFSSPRPHSTRQPRDHSAQVGLWHPPQLLSLLGGTAPGPLGGAMKLALRGTEHLLNLVQGSQSPP